MLNLTSTDLLGLLLLVGCLGFTLGYFSGVGDREQLLRASRDANRRLQESRRNLIRWVRENWPDEYNAYHRGIDTGYQQGVSQASDLEDVA